MNTDKHRSKADFEPRRHEVTKRALVGQAPLRVFVASWFNLFLVCLCVLTTLTGCNYNSGYSTPGDEPKGWYQWRSLYREDVRTVAVPIFKNKDFRRGVEFSLSKALVNQLEMRTPYKVVERGKADTVLEGEIVDISVHTISQDSRASVPQEQLYDIKVNFTWKDQRNGQILVDRKNFQQTTTFYATLGEGEFVGSQTGVEKLAIGIVQELQADW